MAIQQTYSSSTSSSCGIGKRVALAALAAGFASAMLMGQAAAPTAPSQPPVIKPPELIAPLTPSAKIKAPYPPHIVGCHRLVNGQWQQLPCTTPEFMKAHPLPPPVVANSIQSLPKRRLPIFEYHPMTFTSPLVWGSVSVGFLGDPVSATEVNEPKATAADPTPTSVPNQFSIQTNTNDFTCTTCKAGYPIAATAGVANSASQPGDRAWVQFVYQQGAPSLANRLCVWGFDVTVGWNTQGKATPWLNQCIDVTSSYPLTGPGAANDASEIIGYVTCPNAGSNANCLLEAVAYLPWAGGWYSVSSPDTFGLAGNWTNVSGSIYGLGGGSESFFTNTQFKQLIQAYSCFVEPSDASGYSPQACTPPVTKFPLTTLFDLSAAPETVDVTAETNDLNNAPANFQCGAYYCQLWFDSSAP